MENFMTFILSLLPEHFITFIGSLLSLVICMAAGFICRKANVLDDSLTAGLSSLLVKVTMPCSIFTSMMRPFTQTLLRESLAAFFLSAAVYLAGGLLGIGLARLMKAGQDERKVWIFALIFANVGYMGFPVTQAVFGGDAMIYASMTNASFNLLTFTVGIKIFTGSFTGESGQKNSLLKIVIKIVLNPAILCIIIGFVFFLGNLRPPGPLADSIQMIGAMTTPVSMLVVGSLVAKNKLRSLISDVRVLPLMAARLLVLPVLAWLVLSRVIGNPLLLGVLVTMPGMPVGAITAIFAEKYGGDSALASKVVVLSTLLSVLTIPVISLLL
jgi:predicted permease